MKKPGAVTGQRFVKGGFALGLVVGLLIGLALALGVALYITKAPVPFINKVPQRTVEQDQAEAERNKTWEPNAPLAPKVPRPAVGATGAASGAVTGGATGAVTGAPVPAAAPTASAPTAVKSATAAAASPVPAASGARPGRDPAAILSGGVSTAPGADPFTYFLQVGAYTKAEDAEAQRAKLAIQGFAAKVHEREQAGRTVYRVRLGPIEQKSEADALQARLQGAGLESQLVRVQNP